jgi:hypothetical protein
MEGGSCGRVQQVRVVQVVTVQVLQRQRLPIELERCRRCGVDPNLTLV